MTFAPPKISSVAEVVPEVPQPEALAAHHSLDLVGDVMAKDTAAIAIYERLGWQRIGSTMHDTGHGTQVPAHLYVSPAPQT